MPELIFTVISVLIGLVIVIATPVCLVLVSRLSRRLEAAEHLARQQQTLLILLRDKLQLQQDGGTAAARPSAPTATPEPAPTPTPEPAPTATPDPALAPPQPATPHPQAAATRRDAPPAQPAPTRDLESFLGGRVLLIAGVIAVLFALGFFLKIAIDRGWIGPAARVAIGLGCGVACLLVGDRLSQRLGTFGQGIMGAGLGALYISIWFAAARYELISRPGAFAATAAITALGVALALWREAPLLAWLGFLGGYLGPALLGQNQDSLEALSGWLLLLHGGVLAVLCRRRLPGLELLPLVTSTVYFAAWSGRHYEPDRAGPAAACLALLFGLQLLITMLPHWLARRQLSPLSLAAAGLAGLAMVGFGMELFFEDQRLLLGGAVAALGLLYALAATAQTRRRNLREPDSETLWAFALAALAVSLPILIDGRGLEPAWAFAGLAAVLAGARLPSRVFSACGLVMIGLALIRVGAHDPLLHDQPFTAFFNGELVAALCPGVAAVLAGRMLGRSGKPLRSVAVTLITLGAWQVAGILAAEAHAAVTWGELADEPMTLQLWARCAVSTTLTLCAMALAWRPGRQRDALDHLPFGPLAVAHALTLTSAVLSRQAPLATFTNIAFGAGLATVAGAFVVSGAARNAWRKAAGVAGLIALLLLLTFEIRLWGQQPGTADFGQEERRFAAQVITSAVWALYAATLVGLGFWRRLSALRWMGLGLFALTVGKVFLRDTARLDAAYRVGSFLALGLALVAVAYLYNRASSGDVPPAA